MCLGALLPSGFLASIAAPNIHPVGNWLQMLRVDAMPDAAKMVKLKPIGNGAHQSLICKPMSEHRTPM